MNLTDACIKRPILAWVIMLGVVLVGCITASRLGISQSPDIEQPELSIYAGLPGASPEQVESTVTEVMEDALAGMEGIKHITAESSQGGVSLFLEYRGKRAADALVQDVQQRLAAVQTRMPKSMRPPTIRKSSANASPILYFSLAGTANPRELSAVAYGQVIDVLQSVPGVGSAVVWGVRQRQVRVWVDAQKLWLHKLTVQDLVDALAREHLSASGGELQSDAGTTRLELSGEATALDTLRALPVRRGALPGEPAVSLGDVSTVEDGFADENARIRVNGVPSAVVAVSKRRGANAVKVAHAVREAASELNKVMPSGVHLALDDDYTQRTEQALHDLFFELVMAIAVTGLCCRIFLGTWQSTFNVICAVPMSLLGSCAVLYVCDFTLNLYTMLGLTVAVGIVVDDAIMVLESIDRESLTHSDPKVAASVGTRRIAFAALAATLGVICIFAPVMFMEGAEGQQFLQLGVALSVAVLLSYLEAVTLAPARSAQRFMASKSQAAQTQARAQFWRHHENRLGRLLSPCVQHPGRTTLVALVLCAAGLSLFSLIDIGEPEQGDDGLAVLHLETPAYFTLAQTDAAARAFEAHCQADPDTAKTLFINGSSAANKSLAFIYLKDKRKARTPEVTRRLLADLDGFAPLKASSYDSAGMRFSVWGGSRAQLTRESQRMVDALQRSKLFAKSTSTQKPGPAQLVLEPDRAALADAGISYDQVTRTLGPLLAGTDVGYFNLDGRRTDVRLQLPPSAREHADQLTDIMLRGSRGDLVPITAVTRAHHGVGPVSLHRLDRQPSIDISAVLHAGASPEQAKEAIDALGKQLPGRVQLSWRGDMSDQEESQAQLYMAMALGVAFAYLILAAQLNSLWLPCIVLLAIPLAASGAALTLWLGGMPLSEMALIGLLLLFGLVKKNSIMLVDCAVELENQGMTARQAAVEAAKTRLRPILMTTCATMVAVMPAALALGPGGAERQVMAWVVLGGLLSSTLLSLVVVPAVYGFRLGKS